MEFQVRCVRITTNRPRSLGNVGVNVQCFVLVVIHQLLDERRHQVVGHLCVRRGQNTGRVNVFRHGVHANPRHFVHASEFVLVVRLVLVKDNGQVERIRHFVDTAALHDGELLR